MGAHGEIHFGPDYFGACIIGIVGSSIGGALAYCGFWEHNMFYVVTGALIPSSIIFWTLRHSITITKEEIIIRRPLLTYRVKIKEIRRIYLTVKDKPEGSYGSGIDPGIGPRVLMIKLTNKKRISFNPHPFNALAIDYLVERFNNKKKPKGTIVYIAPTPQAQEKI
jgi:uncharacterized membrane protein YeaQ/YmgE (transglycosylase-associated protein family)